MCQGSSLFGLDDPLADLKSKSDADNLAQDWKNVGKDMNKVYELFESEYLK